MTTRSWTLCLCGVLCLSATLSGCKKDEDAEGDHGPALELTFLFEEVAGLKAGDVVLLRGVEAGKVQSVELEGRVEVAVRVSGKYRDAVRSRCYGWIEQSQVGASKLEIKILDPDSPPIENGATREGATTTLAELKIVGAYEGERALGRAGEAIGDGAKKAKDYVTGEGADKAREAARRAGSALREGAGVAKEKAGEAAERAGEALKDGAGAVKEKAGEAAEKTKEAVGAGLDKVRGLLD